MLAFEQYSAGEEDGAIAAQLTDSVTAELARLGTVSVVSHTSAMQFDRERKPLREIAAALNAGFIVEASVENVAGGISVMARRHARRSTAGRISKPLSETDQAA